MRAFTTYGERYCCNNSQFKYKQTKKVVDMTDAIDKPVETPSSKKTTKQKPPTQTAGVTGIDAHGSMGEAPIEPSINWQKLINLPSFEMFVFEESGQTGSTAGEWISQRRAGMGDDKLYDLYVKWHRAKGYWPDETPMGTLIQEVK